MQGQAHREDERRARTIGQKAYREFLLSWGRLGEETFGGKRVEGWQQPLLPTFGVEEEEGLGGDGVSDGLCS